MNKDKLKFAIEAYISKRSSNGDYYNEDWSDRIARKEYYSSFTKDKLLKMTTDDMLEYIGKLWSMLIWGNKKYVVDKLISDNGLENLKEKLADRARHFKRSEEGVRSMCRMLEEMRDEVAEKKEAQIIYGLVKDGIITVDTAKAHFKLTDSDIKKIMQNS